MFNYLVNSYALLFRIITFWWKCNLFLSVNLFLLICTIIQLTMFNLSAVRCQYVQSSNWQCSICQQYDVNMYNHPTDNVQFVSSTMSICTIIQLTMFNLPAVRCQYVQSSNWQCSVCQQYDVNMYNHPTDNVQFASSTLIIRCLFSSRWSELHQRTGRCVCRPRRKRDAAMWRGIKPWRHNSVGGTTRAKGCWQRLQAETRGKLWHRRQLRVHR